MDWKKAISEKSMNIVISHEESLGRKTKRVHTSGVGYDILSVNENEERYIEVKATSESWSSYNWLPLYYSEVKALNNNPDKFFLYIVRFDLDIKNRNEETLNSANHEIFIISGHDLLNDFNIKPETFSLSPISQRKLKKYSTKYGNTE
jgi:hypothetical protein